GVGDFVVTWSSYQDGYAYGVFGQRYSNSGLAVGSEFQVNTYTAGYQVGPLVAFNGFDNFVVAWQSLEQDGQSGGIFAQRFSTCASVPLMGCRTAGKSILQLKQNLDDNKDKLVWKWIKGQ